MENITEMYQDQTIVKGNTLTSRTIDKVCETPCESTFEKN